MTIAEIFKMLGMSTSHFEYYTEYARISYSLIELFFGVLTLIADGIIFFPEKTMSHCKSSAQNNINYELILVSNVSLSKRPIFKMTY